MRGIKNVGQLFMMTMAAYNLVRMRTLGQLPLTDVWQQQTARTRRYARLIEVRESGVPS